MRCPRGGLLTGTGDDVAVGLNVGRLDEDTGASSGWLLKNTVCNEREGNYGIS